MSYFLITTPTGPLLWQGSVEHADGVAWLLSPEGRRVWSVATDAIRQLTLDEALAHVAKGKAR